MKVTLKVDHCAKLLYAKQSEAPVAVADSTRHSQLYNPFMSNSTNIRFFNGGMSQQQASMTLVIRDLVQQLAAYTDTTALTEAANATSGPQLAACTTACYMLTQTSTGKYAVALNFKAWRMESMLDDMKRPWLYTSTALTLMRKASGSVPCLAPESSSSSGSNGTYDNYQWNVAACGGQATVGYNYSPLYG